MRISLKRRLACYVIACTPHTALQFAVLDYKARSNSGSTVAQTWRVNPKTPKKPRPPLDETRLTELALRYAGRYATTRAKLGAYLNRKIGERGWSGDRPPDPESLVKRFAELRYVDDAAFATMKGGSLGRRGYGARRVADSLRAAGVEENDRQEAEETARNGRWEAASAFAKRKRIGPFAIEQAERDVREKQLAAFIRAGHDFATARAWVSAAPGEPPERDE